MANAVMCRQSVGIRIHCEPGGCTVDSCHATLRIRGHRSHFESAVTRCLTISCRASLFRDFQIKPQMRYNISACSQVIIFQMRLFLCMYMAIQMV